MWLASKPLPEYTRRHGFTLVEVMFIIVVIAILAVITIIAYNGVQARAHLAVLQSDLSGAAEQLGADNATNGSYPSTAAASNNGLGLKASPGTTYQYTYTAATNSYCLTGTNSAVSYFVTSSNNTPQAGACPGDINGGAIAAPTGLSVGATDDNDIALSWMASMDATSYTSQCAADSAFSVNVHQATSSSTTVTVSGLSPSGTWWCEVDASYSGGTSQWSTAVSASLACPSGFIVVPGSVTYGTSDFCVMKYEAKQASSTVPVSQASGLPWGNISQTSAIAYSPNVAGCAGCHLITEAEWLTIAQNVLNVASNWSGGSVGSGYIYSGHNDSAPLNALAADTNDADGYYGETNQGGNQRRTLTLSNGQVIWDLAGNMYEWTNATIAGNNQPGFSGGSSYVWTQWNNPSLVLRGLASSELPSYGTPAASNWTSAQGIGELFSNYGESAVHAYMRGGNWTASSYGGVEMLTLYNAPNFTDPSVGFRVTR